MNTENYEEYLIEQEDSNVGKKSKTLFKLLRLVLLFVLLVIML